MTAEKLYAYIIDTIVNEPEGGSRVQIMKFFLTVAQKCLDRNDFANAMNICLAFSHSSVDHMQTAWDEVYVKTQYRDIREKLDKLFYGINNYAPLRRRLVKCKEINKAYLPPLAVCMKDLNCLNEACEAKVFANATLEYNIEKLTLVKNSIHRYLTPQHNVSKYTNKHTFKTNIHSLLSEHEPQDDDLRHTKAEQVKLSPEANRLT